VAEHRATPPDVTARPAPRGAYLPAGGWRAGSLWLARGPRRRLGMVGDSGRRGASVVAAAAAAAARISGGSA
jgi:hypothetical protein